MIGKLASAISQIEEQFLDLDQNFSTGMYSSGPGPMNGEGSSLAEIQEAGAKLKRMNEEEIEED